MGRTEPVPEYQRMVANIETQPKPGMRIRVTRGQYKKIAGTIIELPSSVGSTLRQDQVGCIMDYAINKCNMLGLSRLDYDIIDARLWAGYYALPGETRDQMDARLMAKSYIRTQGEAGRKYKHYLRHCPSGE